jgi:hypothetical protein
MASERLLDILKSSFWGGKDIQQQNLSMYDLAAVWRWAVTLNVSEAWGLE